MVKSQSVALLLVTAIAATTQTNAAEIPIRIFKEDQSLVLVESYSNVLTVSKYTNEYYKDSSQVWLYTPELTQLRSKSRPGDCLDAYLEYGVYKVHTWPCDLNNENQRWKVNLSNGKIRHQTHTGPGGRPVCLDVDSGRLQTWECNDAPWDTNQIWNVRGTQEVNVVFSDAFYARNPPNYGSECLRARDGEVQALYIHPKNGFVGSGLLGEIWSYDPVSQLIRTGANPKLCLDAWEPKNGGNLHTYSCDYQNINQHWEYDQKTGQLRHLTHRNFCLDRGLDNNALTSGYVSPYLWKCHSQQDVYAYLQQFSTILLV